MGGTASSSLSIHDAQHKKLLFNEYELRLVQFHHQCRLCASLSTAEKEHLVIKYAQKMFNSYLNNFVKKKKFHLLRQRILKNLLEFKTNKEHTSKLVDLLNDLNSIQSTLFSVVKGIIIGYPHDLQCSLHEDHFDRSEKKMKIIDAGDDVFSKTSEKPYPNLIHHNHKDINQQQLERKYCHKGKWYYIENNSFGGDDNNPNLRIKPKITTNQLIQNWAHLFIEVFDDIETRFQKISYTITGMFGHHSA